MDVVGLFFVGFLVGEAYDFVSFVGSSFSRGGGADDGSRPGIVCPDRPGSTPPRRSPARPPRYGASPGCMNA